MHGWKMPLPLANVALCLSTPRHHDIKRSKQLSTQMIYARLNNANLKHKEQEQRRVGSESG